MLSDLDGRLMSEVVSAPYKSLVLKAGSASLNGGMNSPVVRGGEFTDESMLDKGGQGQLEGRLGREGPDGSSLSFYRDLLGGILAWLLRHQGVGQ